MKTFILLIVLIWLFSGCVTPKIEERCLRAGLRIDSLQIEDTVGNSAHATVMCSTKLPK